MSLQTSDTNFHDSDRLRFPRLLRERYVIAAGLGYYEFICMKKADEMISSAFVFFCLSSQSFVADSGYGLSRARIYSLHMSQNAAAVSAKNIFELEISLRLSIPVSFPFSHTGSRRNLRWDMSLAASVTECSGLMDTAGEVIISQAGVLSQSFSCASTRVTISLSVTIPFSCPS